MLLYGTRSSERKKQIRRMRYRNGDPLTGLAPTGRAGRAFLQQLYRLGLNYYRLVAVGKPQARAELKDYLSGTETRRSPVWQAK